jgi:DNA-binding SARP family transcriptional activator
MSLSSTLIIPPERERVDASSVMICVLGNFRLLSGREQVHVQAGSKLQNLLCKLILQHGRRVARDVLIESLWPRSDSAGGTASLNSLVYSVHRLLGNDRADKPLIVHADGYYRLNGDAGFGVDSWSFEELVNDGDRLRREGRDRAAATVYARAVNLYRGDFCAALDVPAIVERERLRSMFLGTLSYLADFYYQAGDYSICLEHAERILNGDPCREDAHRVIMRCYVRLGQRAQAMRQYHLCEQILQAEFGAGPEHATIALLDQVRHDPDSV